MKKKREDTSVDHALSESHKLMRHTKNESMISSAVVERIKLDTVYGIRLDKDRIMMLGSKKFHIGSSDHIIIDGVRCWHIGSLRAYFQKSSRL